MATVQYKITYRIDSNATQVATLMTCLALHCRVYNALWMNTAVGMPHLRPLSTRNPDK
jgi:hypothetical protein